jgi:glycosyltransferase involved in cell wall biosynthesis
MNIFIIPSWYPSPSHRQAGIFFKEQAVFLAEENPALQVGLSLWGQEDANLYLAKKDFPHYLPKLGYYHRLQPSRHPLRKNLTEYYDPVLLWNRKFLGGNFRALLRVNVRNFQRFQQETGKVDVIHAHVAYPAGLVAMHLSRRFGVPFVVTEHMGPFPFRHLLRPDGRLREFVALPLRQARQTIAVSPALAQRMVSFGLPTPLVIPNVVDEDFFCPAPNPVPNQEFTFFALGSVEESKGFGDLLSAFREVVRQRPAVRLRIGDHGSKLAAYKALTEELGLQDRVTWLGELTREQARAEHQQADAFVLPSHYESFGVVFAEAIACGKPVLATRCGGPESIVNETNGLLCEVGDVPGIARRMLELVAGRERYDGQAIRADFMGRFSKRAVVPQVLGVYREVVRGFRS